MCNFLNKTEKAGHHFFLTMACSVTPCNFGVSTLCWEKKKIPSFFLKLFLLPGKKIICSVTIMAINLIVKTFNGGYRLPLSNFPEICFQLTKRGKRKKMAMFSFYNFLLNMWLESSGLLSLSLCGPG